MPARRNLQAALSQFGSGWAWLVIDGGVLKTSKPPMPISPDAGLKPFLPLTYGNMPTTWIIKIGAPTM